MSREFKFRAFWNNEMQYDCHLETYSGMTIFGILNDKDYPKDYVKVMQYTGLKDKNGKEIYEGDIVTVSYGTQWAKHKALEYVIFEDGQFMTNEGHKLGRKGTEVVGNIYENHELLK